MQTQTTASSGGMTTTTTRAPWTGRDTTTTSAGTTSTPAPGPSHIAWDTTTHPMVEYGAAIAFVLLLLGLGVSYYHGVRYLKGSLRSAWRFHRWANIGILVALLNGCAMCGLALNVFMFASANEAVFESDPIPYLGMKRSRDAVRAGCTCLFIEGFLTTLVAGVSFKMVAPWDAAWDVFSQRERWQIIVLQVWWGLTFFATWAARAALLGMWHHFRESLPKEIARQLVGETLTAFADTIFVIWWCAASTWWRRTDYTQYTCPVCDGTGASCDDCENGIQYRSA